MRLLIEAVGSGGEQAFGEGRLKFRPGPSFAGLVEGADLADIRLPPEGSNSGAILGDRLFLKGYRRLRPGINPEAEMGRFLTEVSPFTQIVPLAGTIDYEDGRGVGTTLVLMQGYVFNQGDLWGYTLDLLDRLWDDHMDRAEDWDGDAAQIAYTELMTVLGRRTAELHAALARTTGDPDFDPEPVSGADLSAWVERVQVGAEETLKRLDQAVHENAALDERSRTLARQLLDRRSELEARIRAATPAQSASLKTRVHGDLHLGQVLVVQDDVVFIDFEGEPKRSLEERRAKQSPLVDVAGIVRSFDYAAHIVLEKVCGFDVDSRGRAGPVFSRWRRDMVGAFLTAYLKATIDTPALPGSAGEASALIDLFSLEKALYEVRYELDSRPDWVAIPLQGVLASLE